MRVFASPVRFGQILWAAAMLAFGSWAHAAAAPATPASPPPKADAVVLEQAPAAGDTMLAKIVSSYVTALSVTGSKPETGTDGAVTGYSIPDTTELYKNYQDSYGPLLGSAGVNIRGYVTGTWLQLIKAGFIIGLIAIFLQVAFSAKKGQVTVSDMGWALAKTFISSIFIYQPGLLYALVITVSSGVLQLMRPSALESQHGVVAETEVRMSMERGMQSSVAVVDGILSSEKPDDPNAVYWIANLAGKINDLMRASAKEGVNPPYIVATGAEAPIESDKGVASGPQKKTPAVPISSTPNAKTIMVDSAIDASEAGVGGTIKVPETLFYTDTRIHRDEMFAVKKQIRENLKEYIRHWDTEWKQIPEYQNASFATRWGNAWARWMSLYQYETPKDWTVPNYWLSMKDQSAEAMRHTADPSEGTKIATRAGETAREGADHLLRTLVVDPAYGNLAGDRWDAGERLAAPFRKADVEESSWMSKFQEWIRSLFIGGMLRLWGYVWLGGIELVMALMLLSIPAWVHPKTEKSFTSAFSVLMTLMIFPACHTVILFLFERISTFAMEKSGAIYSPQALVTTGAVTILVFLVSIPIAWKFMNTLKAGGSLVGLAAKTTLAGIGAAATLAIPALRVASMAGSAALAKGATAAGATATSMGTAAAASAKAGGLAGYARAAGQQAGAVGARLLSWGAAGASKAVDYADDTAAKVSGVDDKYLRKDMTVKQKAAGALSAMNSTVIGGVKSVASGGGATAVFDEIRRGGERKRQAEDFAGKKQEHTDVQTAVGEQTKAAERQIQELQAIRKGIDAALSGQRETPASPARGLAPKTPDFAPTQTVVSQEEPVARTKPKLKAPATAPVSSEGDVTVAAESVAAVAPAPQRSASVAASANEEPASAGVRVPSVSPAVEFVEQPTAATAPRSHLSAPPRPPSLSAPTDVTADHSRSGAIDWESRNEG